jgi:DNA repair protein RecO (recombination protein O)
MFFRYRTEAFSFKKEDTGEFDELFSFYTKDFGKIEVLARGIKKMKSKLRGSVDLFTLSKIEFVQGKTFKTLTDALLIERFNSIKKNLFKLKLVFAISDFLDSLLIAQEKDEKIWNLIIETLFLIENSKNEISLLRIYYYYFFWNLVSFLGYKPELYFCFFCQKRIRPNKIYFIPSEGSLVCQSCAKKGENLIKVEPETIKILRILLEKEPAFLKKLKIKNQYFKGLDKITKEFFSSLVKKEKSDILK